MIYRYKEPVQFMTRFAVPESLYLRFREYHKKRQVPMAELCREGIELLMANHEFNQEQKIDQIKN